MSQFEPLRGRSWNDQRQTAEQGAVSAIESGNGPGAESQSDPLGPVRITGTVRRECTYDPSTITVAEWFNSPALATRYGRAEIRFETCEYNRDAMPEDVSGLLPRRGTQVTRSERELVLGSESEWRRAEAGGGQSPATVSVPAYDGPVWNYRRTAGGLFVRADPMNLVWETPHRTFDDVVSKLESGPYHGGRNTPESRYIFCHADGFATFVSEDRCLGTPEYWRDTPDQVRLWRDRGTFGDERGAFHVGSVTQDSLGALWSVAQTPLWLDSAHRRMKDFWTFKSDATVHQFAPGVAVDGPQKRAATEDGSRWEAAHVAW